jgi:hypothetical protein
MTLLRKRAYVRRSQIKFPVISRIISRKPSSLQRLCRGHVTTKIHHPQHSNLPHLIRFHYSHRLRRAQVEMSWCYREMEIEISCHLKRQAASRSAHPMKTRAPTQRGRHPPNDAAWVVANSSFRVQIMVRNIIQSSVSSNNSRPMSTLQPPTSSLHPLPHPPVWPRKITRYILRIQSSKVRC